MSRFNIHMCHVLFCVRLAIHVKDCKELMAWAKAVAAALQSLLVCKFGHEDSWKRCSVLDGLGHSQGASQTCLSSSNGSEMERLICFSHQSAIIVSQRNVMVLVKI